MRTRGRLAAALALVVCTAASAAFADDIDDRVRSRFRDTMNADVCLDAAAAEPTTHAISYRDPLAEAKAPPQAVRLYKFLCVAAAYTTVHVYFTYSEIAGIQQVFFAVPNYDVECTPADALECRIARIVVNGMATVGELPNAEFTAATLTLTSRGCWRGPCDAFAEGMWVFQGGRFVLKTYDVDATYDGAQTPQRIVDFAGAP